MKEKIRKEMIIFFDFVSIYSTINISLFGIFFLCDIIYLSLKGEFYA